MAKGKTYAQFLKGYMERAGWNAEQLAKAATKHLSEYAEELTCCSVEDFLDELGMVPYTWDHEAMIKALQEAGVRVNVERFNAAYYRNLTDSDWVETVPGAREMMNVVRRYTPTQVIASLGHCEKHGLMEQWK